MKKRKKERKREREREKEREKDRKTVPLNQPLHFFSLPPLHSAPTQRTGGFAGEIATSVQESCFLSLEAPVARVTGYDTPFPLVFEKYYVPDALKNFEMIKQTVRY